MVSRRIYVVLLGVLAAPLAIASLAWACVPRGIVSVAPSSGETGSKVTVVGTGFPPEVPIDVRWNGLDGERLTGAVGPQFSVEVTIPRVGAGNYVISAATSDEHAAHSEGKAPFDVTGGAADAGAAPTTSAPKTPVLNPFVPTPSAGGKVISGTAGPDRLVGTSARDVIRCGGGNDVVVAGGGNDFIDCGGGNDRVDGGSGNDEIVGGSGNDTLNGGAGTDELVGAAGNDKLSGGLGADEINGGPGTDTLRGNGGRDRLVGAAGRDTLFVDRTDIIVRGAGDRIRR